MKKSCVLVLSFLLFVFFCLSLNAYASSKYIILMDTVNIRIGAGTNYDVLKTSGAGTIYYLKGEALIEDASGGCQGGWYEINYNGSSGYVCSEYVNVYDEDVNLDDIEPTTACEIELFEKGFPSSYFVPLCKLKEKHPNWSFEPITTGLDFNTVVAQESKCGKSYIYTSNSYYVDSTCKSAYSSSSPWKPASYGAIQYYIDPRNFFTERYIFMFETLSYVDQLDAVYAPAVTSVIRNAHFYTYHLGIEHDLGEVIKSAGKNIGVSPTFIASRIVQEIGNSDSLYNLYSGVYPGYEGYYNFYNYGVSDSCATTNGTTYCGLSYAKSQGWYGLNAAIEGGVKSINNNYIQAGQYTRYLQKFNVVPKNSNSIYSHQYMTNIQAPMSEGSTAYSSYLSAGAIDSNFTFSIPVYVNMPTYTTLPTSDQDNVGSGAADDNFSDQDVSSSSSSSSLAVQSIITSSGYQYSGNYLLGIELGTTVGELDGNLESVGGSGVVSITNSKGLTASENDVIGTGYQVTIKGSTTSTYTVVIYGDVSGDGKIGALDLLYVQRSILGVESLSGAYLESADSSRDGKVGALDLLVVQRHILNVEIIKQ